MTGLPSARRADLAPTTIAIDDAINDLLLRDLEPAIGVIGSLLDQGLPRVTRHGEPDGFDGIDRVGELDHLLASEWLLIGEEPDEFLRRYDARELGYLRRRRIERVAAPTSLVVFDTGPQQLGRPRVAHLAALVALARRADDARVPLRWGTLASHERSTVSVQTVRELLDARTASPGIDAHADLVADDALVVSSGAVSASCQLKLVETVDGLEATVVNHATGSSTRGLVPLPGTEACLRMFRDPLGTRRRSGRTDPRLAESHPDLRPTSNLVFDEQANKLLGRTGEGRSLLLFPSPNSPNDVPGPVRIFEAPGHLPVILAAGRVGKLVISLQIDDEGAYLARQGNEGHRLPRGRFRAIDWTPSAIEGPPPLGRLWIEDRAIHAEADGKVVVLTEGSDGFVVAAKASSIPATWSAGRHSVSIEPGPWRIVDGRRSFEVDLGGAQPIACGVRPGVGPGALVVVAEDRRTIQFIGERARETVAVAPGEIVDATAARRRPSVAVRTADDDVLIWDWTTGYELYRWSPS